MRPMLFLTVAVYFFSVLAEDACVIRVAGGAPRGRRRDRTPHLSGVYIPDLPANIRKFYHWQRSSSEHGGAPIRSDGQNANIADANRKRKPNVADSSSQLKRDIENKRIRRSNSLETRTDANANDRVGGRIRSKVNLKVSLARDTANSVSTISFIGTNTLHFDISGYVGKGSFGAIFRGILSDGTVAAIKVSKGSLGIRALAKEASRMALVSGQKGVPELYAHGVSNPDKPAELGLLAMEYFPRGDVATYIQNTWDSAHSGAYYTLADLLRNPFAQFRHPLRIIPSKTYARHAKMLNLATDAFANLRKMNDKLIHHDIKPENVLMDKDGMFVVSDLGDGTMYTPEYMTERLVYGRSASAADDCFAMLLTLLQHEGLMSPWMVSERLKIRLKNFPSINLRSILSNPRLGAMVLPHIRKWDKKFRFHVLVKAVRSDTLYRVWLDLWDLLKSPSFNSLSEENINSPHWRITELLQEGADRLKKYSP